MIRHLPLSLVVFLSALLPAFAQAQSRQFPADSRVLNVLSINPNANDGVTIARAAIQQAINQSRGWGVRGTVYLPNGTYLLDGPLDYFVNSQQNSGVTIQGESEHGVILKLMDNATGYDNPAAPRTVIQTFDLDSSVSFSNSLFFNNFFDFTIDTGSGNPGAIGITFYAHNQGSIRNVTIRAGGDGAGVCGIDMYRFSIPGPALIKDVVVEGFDYGVRLASGGNYHMTMDRLTLRDQKVAGMRNDGMVIAVHDLRSENTVPALLNTASGSFTTLIKARLDGGAPGNHAIVNTGFLFARDVVTTGYAGALAGEGANLAEYVSHPVINPAGGATTSLNLPIEETPEIPWDPVSQWVNVMNYGATPDNNSNDDSVAVQAAIDDMERLGATTLYFPRGAYVLDNTVIVRGNVRRIVGLMSSVNLRVGVEEDRGLPTWRLENTRHPVLFIDRMIVQQVDAWRKNGVYFDNVRTDPLVLAHIFHSQGPIYKGHTDSKVFLDDVSSLRRFSVASTLRTPLNRPKFDFGANRVWARQFDPEEDNIDLTGPMVRSDGGQVVILGMKTEGPSKAFGFYGGARAELFGGIFLPGEPFKDQEKLPWAFEIEHSEAAITATAHRFGPRTFYTDVVREVQASGTYLTRLGDASVPTRNNADEFVLPLYRSAAITPEPVRTYPYLQDDSPAAVVLIEAENYDRATPLDPWFSNRPFHEWTQVVDAGLIAMQAAPDVGTTIVRETTSHFDPQHNATKSTVNTEVNPNARLDYSVFFRSAGTYYVWLRANAPDANGDEANLGLDGGFTPATGTSVTGFPFGQYGWSGTLKSGARARVHVASAGLHTVNLWMKEDGLKVDQILITSDAAYNPATTTAILSARGSDFIGTGGGLSILTGALPPALEGAPYGATLLGSGGTPPYTWSLASGTLPSGIALDAVNGTLSGTPAVPGVYTFTLRLATADASTSRPFALQVDADTVPVITTTALPDAQEGQTVSEPLGRTGGNGPFVWTVAAGSLPPGVTLSQSDGVLSGVPSAAGEYSFTVSVTDAQGEEAVQALTWSILPPPVALLTTLVYDAEEGADYRFELAASGGVAPYQWTLASGALPAGLVLDAAGEIRGIPAAVGPANFTLRVTAANGDSSTRAFTMSVVPAGTVPHLLARWTFNEGVTDEVGGNGGALFGTAAIVDDNGNPVLKLDGNQSYLEVPGVAGLGSTQQLTVMAWVRSDTATWNAFGLPLSYRNRFILHSAGGTRNWDFYISDGFFLRNVSATAPAGTEIRDWHLYTGTYDGTTLRAYLDGQLIGENVVNVPYGPNGNNPFYMGRDLSDRFFRGALDDVTIWSRALSGAEIAAVYARDRIADLEITTADLPGARVDETYSASFAARGGVRPYAWSVATGVLPLGLELDEATGAITGAPLVEGQSEFTLAVTDADGVEVSRSYSIVVAPKAAGSGVRAISVNFHFGAGFAVPTGPSGFGPARVGNAPLGHWNNAVVPAGGGRFANFRDQTNEPVGNDLAITFAALNLTGSREGGAVANADERLGRSMVFWSDAAPAAFTISGLSSIYDLTQDVTVYLIMGNDSGGDRTITFTETGTGASATLTANILDMDSTWVAGEDHAVFSGLREASLTFNYSSAFYNKVGLGGLQIVGVPLGGPEIQPAGPYAAVATVEFESLLQAEKGVAPYTWSVAAGELPSGLSLDASTGRINGVPLAVGDYAAYVRVTDAQGRIDSERLAFTVVAPVAIESAALPNGRVGQPYSVTLNATGGAGVRVWSLAGGALPAGLSLNSEGVISGVPSATGSSEFSVRVIDGSGRQDVAALAITVATPLAGEIESFALGGSASGYIVDMDHDGTGDVVTFNQIVVGHRTGQDRETRGVVKFALSDFPAEDPVVRGVVRLRVRKIDGDAPSLIVESVSSADPLRLVASDYESPGRSLQTLAGGALSVGAIVAIDVGAAVADAWNSGQSHFTLRLRPEARTAGAVGNKSVVIFEAIHDPLSAPNLHAEFDPSLLAWWSFGAGGHDDARGNDAVLRDGAALGIESDNPFLRLDGNGAHAEVASVAGLTGATQLTVAIRARGEAAVWSGGALLSHSNVVRLRTVPGTTAIVGGLFVGGAWVEVTATDIPPGWDASTWHGYALVFDGTQLVLTYDGHEAGRQTVSGVMTPQPVSPLWLGREETGPTFAGSVDDVQVYARPLTAEEIEGLKPAP